MNMLNSVHAWIGRDDGLSSQIVYHPFVFIKAPWQSVYDDDGDVIIIRRRSVLFRILMYVAGLRHIASHSNVP